MLKKNKELLCIILVAVYCCLGSKIAFALSEQFPCPEEVLPRVEFWEKIYSQYTTDEGPLHDCDDLTIIYEIVNIQDIKGHKHKEKQRIKKKKSKYKNILDSIIDKNGLNLSPEEERVYNLFSDKRLTRLRRARHRIRFQSGQKDRFIEGIKLSHRYLNHIKDIIAEMGAPPELMYLPHVESSFNYKAYSKFGAAGIWQFTRNTGKMYMKINYVYDERLDPIKSTRAAVKYLLKSYEKIESWPLALISYNHGQTGIRKAVRKLGTNDFLTIIDNYKSRSFGFASRNFYFEFLAACKVAQNYKDYFGDLQVEEELKYQTYTLKEKVLVQDICAHTDLHRKVIQKYNPALRQPTILSDRYIPKDYVINLPPDKDYKMDELFKNIKPSQPIIVASLQSEPKQKKVTINKDRVDQKVTNRPKPNKTTNKKRAEIPKPIGEHDLGKWADSRYRDELKFVKVEHPYVWVEVSIDETLGHYAEWAGIRASEIRRLNNMRPYSSHLRIGNILKIRLNNVTSEEFEEARIDYHKAIEEDFYYNFEIDSIYQYKVQKGDTLWSLCIEKFDVPQWLFERLNTHVDFDNLMPLTSIIVPVIIERAIYL